MERSDGKRAKALIDEIDTWEDDENQKKESHRIYDIFILKKYSYIDEMEERLKEASGLDKGFLEYLLALQYDNKGDEKKSAMYLEASKKDMITSVEEASKAAGGRKRKKEKLTTGPVSVPVRSRFFFCFPCFVCYNDNGQTQTRLFYLHVYAADGGNDEKN